MRRLLWLVGIGFLASVVARRPGDTSETRNVAASRRAECNPSYPTLCIPVGARDLDCDEISASNFPVRGPDPHGFDADRDGLGCEPWNPRSRR
jgi:micrococcal nuclease